jgi:hypothetical protein
MVWFLVDDNLTFHGKTVEAGNAAMGLWVRAGSWSAATLSDGFIPVDVARRLARKRDADRLVSGGLWAEVRQDSGGLSADFRRTSGGPTRQLIGYQFHEWEQTQQSKSEVEQRRKWERERKAEQRRRRCPTGTKDDVPVGVPGRTRALPKPSQPVVTTGGLAHQRNATRRDPPPGRVVEIEESPPPTENRTEYINAAQNGMPQIRAALTRKPQPL